MPTQTVQGLSELNAKLRKLDEKIQRKALKQAAVAGLEPVLHAARANAPVETGLLISTLEVKGKANKRGIGATLQTRGGSFKGDTFYAAFIEFGHKLGKRLGNAAVGARKRMRRSKELKAIIKSVNDARPMVPANPFMRSAFDENKEAALDIYKQALAAGIEKAAKEKA